MGFKDDVRKLKEASPLLSAVDIGIRNRALLSIRDALIEKKEEIFKANKKDLENAEKNKISEAVKKRLKFDEGKLSSVCDGLKMLSESDDPVGKVSLKRQLDKDLILTRISVPIGVIGVIFEARPDALVQIFSLCLKSANCAVLKGGKETANTNDVLFDIIYQKALEEKIPENTYLKASSHDEIDDLLSLDQYVDLIIPRGSNAFVRYIMDNTKIPVMGHSDGICHVYVDKQADIEKTIPCVIDSKIQYPSACNAAETVLVHHDIAGEFLPLLSRELKKHNVKINGTKEVLDITGGEGDIIPDDGFSREYLDYEVSVKIVFDINEAVSHINRFGSHHTDAIFTEDDGAWRYFSAMVDSAGVYRNCSTRFADGFRYGFGAEVGISTGKIHARGPVGLEGLMSYKYTLEGNGQKVDEYSRGVKKFSYRELV